MAGRDERLDETDETGLFAGSDAAAPSADAAPGELPRVEDAPASARADAAPASVPSWPEIDRRNTPDRREEPTGWLSHPFGFRRRKAGRRAGERDNIYVDVYSPRAVMILLGIFLLNIGDALFTLLWLQRGGGEGNPVMQAMLEIGVGAFLFQKCIIVGIWLLILIAHRNYRAARIGLWSTLTVYTLLITYHLVLVGLDISPVPVEAGQPRGPVDGISEMTHEQDRSREISGMTHEQDRSREISGMTHEQDRSREISEMTHEQDRSGGLRDNPPEESGRRDLSEIAPEQDGDGRLDAERAVAQGEGT